MDSSPNNKPGLLLNEAQAASILNVSIRTLQQWRVSGRGPCFTKMGRSVRYRESDLSGFVEKGMVRSTTEADAKKAVAS